VLTKETKQISLLISDCRRDVDEICALLGYNMALCGNFLGLLTFEDGTGTLFRNVGKQLPPDAA
jgi:hypothetical protein